MHQYRIHTPESAPEKSKPALRGLQQSLGLVPNLAATMAESPVLLGGFVGAFGNFHGGTFTAKEKQTLLLSNAVANACSWAVAFHSTMALREGVDADDVRAIRDKRPPKTSSSPPCRLSRAPSSRNAGTSTSGIWGPFTEAGFGPDQSLEVIAGLAVSVMANYAGNITQPIVEDPFKPQIWKP